MSSNYPYEEHWKNVVLAIVPKVTGTLSVMSSLYIIQHIVLDGVSFKSSRSNKKKATTMTRMEQRRSSSVQQSRPGVRRTSSMMMRQGRNAKKKSSRLHKTYHRLLLGMSVNDCLGSFFSSTLSTWPMPSSSGGAVSYFGAAGSRQTCQMAGWFAQGGNLATPLYNGSLTTFYLLMIVHGWKERQIQKRVEPYLHFIPNIIGWGTAVFGAAFHLFAPADWTCWIAPTPTGCNVETILVGQSHENDIYDPTVIPPSTCQYGNYIVLYRLLLRYGFLWICILYVTIVMWIVYVHVLTTETATDKYNFVSTTGSAVATNNRDNSNNGSNLHRQRYRASISPGVSLGDTGAVPESRESGLMAQGTMANSRFQKRSLHQTTTIEAAEIVRQYDDDGSSARGSTIHQPPRTPSQSSLSSFPLSQQQRTAFTSPDDKNLTENNNSKLDHHGQGFRRQVSFKESHVVLHDAKSTTSSVLQRENSSKPLHDTSFEVTEENKQNSSSSINPNEEVRTKADLCSSADHPSTHDTTAQRQSQTALRTNGGGGSKFSPTPMDVLRRRRRRRCSDFVSTQRRSSIHKPDRTRSSSLSLLPSQRKLRLSATTSSFRSSTNSNSVPVSTSPNAGASSYGRRVSTAVRSRRTSFFTTIRQKQSRQQQEQLLLERRREKSRMIASQSSLFVGALILTSLFDSIVRMMQMNFHHHTKDNSGVPFALMLLYTIFTPLQGFYNMCIYLSPRYQQFVRLEQRRAYEQERQQRLLLGESPTPTTPIAKKLPTRILLWRFICHTFFNVKIENMEALPKGKNKKQGKEAVTKSSTMRRGEEEKKTFVFEKSAANAEVSATTTQQPLWSSTTRAFADNNEHNEVKGENLFDDDDEEQQKYCDLMEDDDLTSFSDITSMRGVGLYNSPGLLRHGSPGIGGSSTTSSTKLTDRLRVAMVLEQRRAQRGGDVVAEGQKSILRNKNGIRTTSTVHKKHSPVLEPIPSSTHRRAYSSSSSSSSPSSNIISAEMSGSTQNPRSDYSAPTTDHNVAPILPPDAVTASTNNENRSFRKTRSEATSTTLRLLSDLDVVMRQQITDSNSFDDKKDEQDFLPTDRRNEMLAYHLPDISNESTSTPASLISSFGRHSEERRGDRGHISSSFEEDSNNEITLKLQPEQHFWNVVKIRPSSTISSGGGLKRKSSSKSKISGGSFRKGGSSFSSNDQFTNHRQQCSQGDLLKEKDSSFTSHLDSLDDNASKFRRHQSLDVPFNPSSSDERWRNKQNICMKERGNNAPTAINKNTTVFGRQHKRRNSLLVTLTHPTSLGNICYLRRRCSEGNEPHLFHASMSSEQSSEKNKEWQTLTEPSYQQTTEKAPSNEILQPLSSTVSSSRYRASDCAEDGSDSAKNVIIPSSRTFLDDNKSRCPAKDSSSDNADSASKEIEKRTPSSFCDDANIVSSYSYVHNSAGATTGVDDIAQATLGNDSTARVAKNDARRMVATGDVKTESLKQDSSENLEPSERQTIRPTLETKSSTMSSSNAHLSSPQAVPECGVFDAKTMKHDTLENNLMKQAVVPSSIPKAKDTMKSKTGRSAVIPSVSTSLVTKKTAQRSTTKRPKAKLRAKPAKT